MAQFIYLIAAMLTLMTLLMTSQQGTDRIRQTEMLNEVSTQLTNAASETLETIGRAYYDTYVYEHRSDEPNQCGRVSDSQQSLFANYDSATNTYSNPNTNSVLTPLPCASFANCPYIEGFHDLNPGNLPGNPDLTIIRGGHGNEKGFAINIEVRVRYVEPTDYSVLPGSETFAKQVAVTAHTPDAYLGDDPTDFNSQFSITLTRVFPYGCPTNPNDIPQPAANQTCEMVGNPVCAFDNGS